MVVAVAVRVVTRQQVAGIGWVMGWGWCFVHKCECVRVQRGTLVLCTGCCPPMGGVTRGGGRETKGFNRLEMR